MKILLTLLFISSLSLSGYSQDKIAGQFTTETVPFTVNQQIAQTGAGTTIMVVRSY